VNLPPAARHGGPLEGHAAMGVAEVERRLRDAVGWSLIDGAIEKTFRFDDYHRTMAFVNAVAWIAHREDHHPDIAFSYDHATIRFNTHSVAGLSENDFLCAAQVEALLD
jgi:4a-hydroxytetrahydrobiopterin dehydratase